MNINANLKAMMTVLLKKEKMMMKKNIKDELKKNKIK